MRKINTFLEENEEYFGGKFKDIGSNIAAMEAETQKNYDDMKKVLNDAYAANKDAIEKSVAARKTAATGQYAGKGYAPEVMANIVAMIDNDPQMAEQLRSVTQKQAENLQNLQNTYNSWYNNIVNQKSTLTANEKTFVTDILDRRQKIMEDLKNMNVSSIDKVFAPTLSYASKVTDSATKNDLALFDKTQDIKNYAAADTDLRKQILIDGLYNYSSSFDRSKITPAMLDAAAKLGDISNALQYLASQTNQAVDLNAVKTATPVRKSTVETSSTVRSEIKSRIDSAPTKAALSAIISDTKNYTQKEREYAQLRLSS